MLSSCNKLCENHKTSDVELNQMEFFAVHFPVINEFKSLKL